MSDSESHRSPTYVVPSAIAGGQCCLPGEERADSEYLLGQDKAIGIMLFEGINHLYHK